MAAAPGETSLSALLSSLNPVLSPTTFVWATIPGTDPTSTSSIFNLLSTLPVQHLFREKQGWTVVVPEDVAANISLDGTFRCRMISLEVHSSLEAVGFIAEVSRKLTEMRCSVNPVSGFYHDHLFVPMGTEEEVMAALIDIAEEARWQ
jgi:hypothetical protein